MSLVYAREKLHLAVNTLSTGTADIKTRLRDAYISCLLPLEAEDLPANLQPELEAIQEEIDRIPAQGDEGSVQATLNTMSDDQCAEMAQKIFSLYEAVIREYFADQNR